MGLPLRSALATVQRTRNRNKLASYQPYPKQREFHDAGRSFRERALIAGNQCLAPDSVIQTAVGERRIVEMLGAGDFGVPSWAGGLRCDATASHVFLKGIETAFRVHLGNGEVFECSRRHWILTSGGWLSLDQLMSRASGWRWTQKDEDYRASYGEDDRHDDQPLLSEEDSGQARPPLQGDVPPNNGKPCNADAEERKQGHSRVYPDVVHHAKKDVLSHVAVLCERLSGQNGRNFVQRTTAKHQIDWRSLFASYLRGEPPQEHRLITAAAAPCEGGLEPFGDEATLGLSGEKARYELQFSFLKGAGRSVRKSYLPEHRTEIFFPYSHPVLTGCQRIVAVENIGCKPILDMTVAGTHCYEAAGVIHHNTGKTYAASMEVAMHLTGQYPDWWRGVRYGGPIVAWTGSESNELSREVIQEALLGTEEADIKAPDMGTGAIPGSSIIKLTKRQAGVQDVVDQIIVQHKRGTSRCVLKTYEQGRAKWQGKRVDLVWPDEEPEPEIYSEALTRTQAVPNGRLMATFSPLKGMTTIVKQFLEPKEGDPPRHVTNMTIYDAEHYTEEQRAAAIAAYPVHERKTRAMGVPMMGEGRVWPIDEDEIKVNPFEIPRHFSRICGVDFGIDHPAAAAWIAHDRDTDIAYLYDCYQKSDQTPIYHAGTIKQRDLRNYIPVAWPHDGLDRDKGGTGRMIWKQYKDHGARMMRESARFEDEKGGAQGKEAAATLMYERMILGTLKVFNHLEPFFEQFRFYHRKDGKIVPINDDILKATMYAMMELRHARVWMPARRIIPVYTQPIAS